MQGIILRQSKIFGEPLKLQKISNKFIPWVISSILWHNNDTEIHVIKTGHHNHTEDDLIKLNNKKTHLDILL